MLSPNGHTRITRSAETTGLWRAPIPPAPLTPREAFFSPHEAVPFVGAVGRISAEIIAPYPPGIPVLVPGELITAETLDVLAAAQRTGIRIAYAADATLSTIQVID